MSPVAKHISSALRLLGPPLADFWKSLLLFVGAGAIAYGAFEIYRPAGMIVGGALLIIGVILNERGS